MLKPRSHLDLGGAGSDGFLFFRDYAKSFATVGAQSDDVMRVPVAKLVFAQLKTLVVPLKNLEISFDEQAHGLDLLEGLHNHPRAAEIRHLVHGIGVPVKP